MVEVRAEMIRKEQEEERRQEEEMLENMQKETKKEHKRIMVERALEKQKFDKMLVENKKKLADLHHQEIESKEEDKRTLQVMMEREEAMQRKREAEFQKRMDNITKKMAQMGGTFDDAREKELRDERRILALQTEKDRRDQEIERARRTEKFNQSQMINQYLQKMMVEREEQKEQQRRKDKELFERNKKELELLNLKEQEKQHQKHLKLIDNYDVVKNQIAYKEAERPKHMDAKEATINRDLLGEMKKRNMIWLILIMIRFENEYKKWIGLNKKKLYKRIIESNV